MFYNNEGKKKIPTHFGWLTEPGLYTGEPPLIPCLVVFDYLTLMHGMERKTYPNLIDRCHYSSFKSSRGILFIFIFFFLEGYFQ
jgi:hypothetical protein